MGLFDKVERGLERAVNSAFAKAFKSEVQPVELASAVRRAMDDRAAVMGHGRTMVPNLYTIELSGTDFERLSGYEEALSDELVAARAGARRLAALPARRPGPDQLPPRRRAGDRRVPGPAGDVRRSIAPSTEAPRRETVPPAQNAPVAAPPRRPTTSPVARPWLVIDGERYPLIGAHTVIGRDELADVVLDDPASRGVTVRSA